MKKLKIFIIGLIAIALVNFGYVASASEKKIFDGKIASAKIEVAKTDHIIDEESAEEGHEADKEEKATEHSKERAEEKVEEKKKGHGEEERASEGEEEEKPAWMIPGWKAVLTVLAIIFFGTAINTLPKFISDKEWEKQHGGHH